MMQGSPHVRIASVVSLDAKASSTSNIQAISVTIVTWKNIDLHPLPLLTTRRLLSSVVVLPLTPVSSPHTHLSQAINVDLLHPLPSPSLSTHSPRTAGAFMMRLALARHWRRSGNRLFRM